MPMKRKHIVWGLLRGGFLATAISLVTFAEAQSAPGYHPIKKTIIGGDGGWDYLTIDPAGRRVFISHETHVVVVDADSGAVIGNIADTPHVHGLAVAADIGRGFTSNGGDDTSSIIDLKTLKTIGKVRVGMGTDAIIYDPASHRVFTFNGDSNDATAIDAAAGKVAGTVRLGGRPEYAAADGAGTVYVNIEDKNQLVAFDSRTLREKNRWPLRPCTEPAGLAIDAAHARLFVGCANKLMAVVDAKTGKIVATLPIGQGVDANRFDPGTSLAFSSNGDGTLTVVHEDTPDKYTVVENVATEKGARTMEVDPKTHNVYLVNADVTPRAPTRDDPHPDPYGYPRPVPVAGTMRLLIFGR